MSNLIDCVYSENDKINVQLTSTGDQVKVLTFDDIKSVVELYRSVYQELKQAKCEKFIHKLNAEEIEEMMSSKESAYVGYFKDGNLAGAMYTKPFESSSPYFQTPSFEEGSSSYAIGGVVVGKQYRGNGVVGKMANVAFNGVKQYAFENPETKIAGTGFEISCENFGSLLSLGGAKDENMNNLFNLAGIHYLTNPQEEDKDLTILGYGSFEKTAENPLYLPKVTLNGNQQNSFKLLTSVIEEIGENTTGITSSVIDGHNITTFNDYIQAPIKDVIAFDSGYSACYPPQLNQ